jgi:hypothetical protein
MPPSVIITPARDRGLVEVFVASRTGAAQLTPNEARAVAAQILVAADAAEGLEPLDLDAALGGGD